jgi:hypothetical protein
MLLCAEQLLAAEEEWDTLRCEDTKLRKLNHLEKLLLIGIGRQQLEAVAEVMVVMAAYVADMLTWVNTPSILAMSHLVMLNTTNNTKLKSLLVTLYAMDEASCLAVESTT